MGGEVARKWGRWGQGRKDGVRELRDPGESKWMRWRFWRKKREEVELEFEEEEGRGQSLDHAREVGREV